MGPDSKPVPERQADSSAGILHRSEVTDPFENALSPRTATHLGTPSQEILRPFMSLSKDHTAVCEPQVEKPCWHLLDQRVELPNNSPSTLAGAPKSAKAD